MTRTHLEIVDADEHLARAVDDLNVGGNIASGGTSFDQHLGCALQRCQNVDTVGEKRHERRCLSRCTEKAHHRLRRDVQQYWTPGEARSCDGRHDIGHRLLRICPQCL